MAVASRRHNCNRQRRQRRHKGQRSSRKIAMNNDYGDGNCGLRRALVGAVAEGGSHPPPPSNQIITINSNAYLFLAINGCGTSSGGGGSGDGSSGARGMCAAVCSSGGVGAAASSVCWWSCRRWQTGAQSQWIAGSQHACASGQRMWHACNSRQQSGVCGTACSSSKRVGAASSTSVMEDSDGSKQRWQRKEQWLTATSC
jgi:hypothetical protein